VEENMRPLSPPGTRPALAALVLALPLLSGCTLYLPDQQSARLLPEGDWELTPSFSSASFTVEGETEHIQNQFGLRFGYGASETLEIRGGVERIALDEDLGEGGVTMIGGGPKLALAPETAALYVPIGLAVGDDIDTSDTWTIAPTVLLTFQASPSLEVSPSVKAIYPFAVEDSELLLGFNLGLGFTAAEGRVILRPEGGLVINPGDDGVSWGWTVGASLRP
jgi:hypothetical protein